MPRAVDSVCHKRREKGASSRVLKFYLDTLKKFLCLSFVISTLIFLSSIGIAGYLGMGEYDNYQSEKIVKEKSLALLNGQLLLAEGKKQAQQISEAEKSKKEETKTLKQANSTQNSSSSRVASVTSKKTAQKTKSLLLTASITAQQIIDHTISSPKQRLDGSYRLEFHTKLDNSGASLTWYPSDEAIGGGGSAPRFSVSFICDPPYDQFPNSPVLDPSFAIKTSYTCDVALLGSNGSRGEKQFKFTTGPGLLAVSRTSISSPYFRDDITSGGLLFSNANDVPIKINGLEFDISFASIKTTAPSGVPAIVRFSEGEGGTTLGEYVLQDTPPDSSQPSSYSRKAVKMAFSLTVNPSSQKAISVKVLGSERTGLDVDPNVTLAFRKIDTDQEIKIVGIPVVLSWTCSVKFLPDDPDRGCR